MVSHIITFLLGAYSGVAFMCLFQINKKPTITLSNVRGEAMVVKTKEVLSMIDARKLLAERVNELCREKEITYEELSSKSEVPLETVLQIADGSVKNPGIFAIAKICEGLNVSLKDFFDTDEFRNIMI